MKLLLLMLSFHATYVAPASAWLSVRPTTVHIPPPAIEDHVGHMVAVVENARSAHAAVIARNPIIEYFGKLLPNCKDIDALLADDMVCHNMDEKAMDELTLRVVNCQLHPSMALSCPRGIRQCFGMGKAADAALTERRHVQFHTMLAVRTNITIICLSLLVFRSQEKTVHTSEWMMQTLKTIMHTSQSMEDRSTQTLERCRSDTSELNRQLRNADVTTQSIQHQLDSNIRDVLGLQIEKKTTMCQLDKCRSDISGLDKSLHDADLNTRSIHHQLESQIREIQELTDAKNILQGEKEISMSRQDTLVCTINSLRIDVINVSSSRDTYASQLRDSKIDNERIRKDNIALLIEKGAMLERRSVNFSLGAMARSTCSFVRVMGQVPESYSGVYDKCIDPDMRDDRAILYAGILVAIAVGRAGGVLGGLAVFRMIAKKLAGATTAAPAVMRVGPRRSPRTSPTKKPLG